MSTLFNCSTVVFGDQSPLGNMNSASSYESSNSSAESSQEAAAMPIYFEAKYCQTFILESAPTNDKPFLKVTEEPVEKFRFRYKSEMMGTHGSILARSHERNRRKIYPSVQLCNFGHPAVVRCSLYTAHPNEKLRNPHTHRLIVRGENNTDKDDPHEMIVSADNNFTAIFHGMGIIHTAKKNIVEELIKKKRVRTLEKVQLKNMNITSLPTVVEAKMRQEAEDEARKMNLNSVSLCFEAFTRDAHNRLLPICDPVFSKPINNMKSALTGELKICRIDKHVSSCMGGEEVFVLVEKVGKKNIKIRFFEVDEDDNEIWYDFGKFSELDVHHQYAIVFRTPPYRDLDIEKPVEVFLQLYRPTDGDRSEPVRFQYKPSEKMGRARKRQRMCNESTPSEQATRILNDLTNGYTPITNGLNAVFTTNNNVTGIEFNASDPVVSGNEYSSLSEILNDENGMDASDFQEFMKNLSISDLNLPQPLSGLGSIGTENLKPVKYETDTACGAFVCNPSDIAFPGALKTEGNGASDYLKTFEDNMDIVCDGGGPVIKQTLIIERSDLKVVNKDRNERRTSKREKKINSDEAPVIKKETAGDFHLLQKVIVQLNTLLQKQLPQDEMSKKIEEIFSVRNEEGDNGLHAAVMTGQEDPLKLMLDVLHKGQHNSIINSRNLSAETPLHLAVLHNQPEFVKMMLNKGADPNAVNKYGNTALHLAVDNTHNECLYEILNMINYVSNEHAPKCDEKNYSGQTPLHLSALKENIFAVKCLVKAGADVNVVDSTLGRTALIVAVEGGCKDIVEHLVKETEVDVNLANYAGNTALHYACVVGGDKQVEICKLLVDSKADPLQSNYEQRSKSADEVVLPNASSDSAYIEIKEEIESEDDLQLRIDEDSEEDTEEDDDDIQGQTSLDLAWNKKEILEILRKADQCRLAGSEDAATVENVQIKEECPSPSETSTVADNGLFDEETMVKLCYILDTSTGWVNLADLLDYTFLVPSIRNATSPTKLLFNYADLHGNVTVENIRSFLEALDEHEAVDVIDLMLARRVAHAE